LVNRGSERIRTSGGAAFATLKNALAGLGRRPARQVHAPEAWRAPGLLEQWSLVHGLATLAIEGQFGADLTSKQRIAAARAVLELRIAGLRRGRAKGAPPLAASARRGPRSGGGKIGG
jgi:hypothetical protein